MAEVTKMQRTKSTIDGSSNLSGIIREDDGSMTNFIITSENQGFQRVMETLGRLRDGLATQEDLAESVRDAMSLANRIEKDINDFAMPGLPLTRKGNHFYVTVNGELEPVDPTLERQMLKASDADGEEARRNWHAMSNFIARLYQNTTRYVREQLFSWLKANFDDKSTHSFTIMPDGRFVGYKGCCRDELNNIVSINSGHGFVNGTEYTNAHLPNNVGDVVSMPREEVQDDPKTGCSTGLHVGTYEYASQFASGVLVRVAVAPEDVVSIPLDCEWQKLRACKYVVLETEDRPVDEFIYNGWTNNEIPPYTIHDVIGFLIDAKTNGDFGEHFSEHPTVNDAADFQALLDKALSAAYYSEDWNELTSVLGGMGLVIDTSEVDGVLDRLEDWVSEKKDELASILEELDADDEAFDEAIDEVMPLDYDGDYDEESLSEWLDGILESAHDMESLNEIAKNYEDYLDC